MGRILVEHARSHAAAKRAGLSTAEAGAVLGVSRSTATNRWVLVRTMLARWLEEPDWLQS